MKKSIFLLLLIIGLVLIGCSNSEINNITNMDKQVEGVDEKSQEESADNKEIELEKNIIDWRIKPNENGQIMILMYHGMSEEESEWVRTAENFKRFIYSLWKGYRLISLRDYINNNIKVEAGFTPVVLTFDGLLNQFNIIEDGINRYIDPLCAVGILEEFYKVSRFGRLVLYIIYSF